MEYKTKLAMPLLFSSFLVMAEPETQLEVESVQQANEAQTLPQQSASSTVESVTPYNLFVTDELFVFMHSGGSTRYRIIGRVAASEEVKIIAKDSESGWLQVELANGRQGWIDNAVLVETAGKKAQLAEAQAQVASLTTRVSSLDDGSEETIEVLNAEVTQLQQTNQALQQQVEELTNQNTELENSKIQTEQTQKILDKLYDVGAVLLGVFAGWLITRRRKSGLSFDRL